MLESSREISPSDIAIVGMALRVPGARNVTEFWQNLRNGVESIRTLSTDELVQSGEVPERYLHPNYVRRTADLAEMEMFDADFFGLSPKEAAIMDPQHRQFLECAWEAMEDAGIPPGSVNGPVGVFAGCGMGSYFYFNICSNRALVEQVGTFLLRHTGNDKDFLATRASFTFNLRGPSVSVQTACSTSLVAVHYACQSLLNGECDMALAGGVTIELPHRRGYLFQEGEILSPDGHCRAFDHRAAGTVFGSGAGVVALRRLEDAIKDGDVIHAVIKSTAVNNDGGSKSGYLAPSVTGQAEAVIEAHGLAGISADTIQYVECHGTGTSLGDPIEIEALTEAFRQSTQRTAFCRIGSLKTNIGHLDTAAGVAGLIKTALALRHQEIPPTLGFEKPNPAIDFAKSPFIVNDRLTDWPSSGVPRRAAVNSLGVGGTNAHVILEEAPVANPSDANRDTEALIFLSARHKAALEQAAGRLASALSNQPGLGLDDVSFTLCSGRKHFEHRMVLAAANRVDAISQLSNPGSKRKFVHSVVEDNTGAVFLFPGGGVQYCGMAGALYMDEPHFRASIDEGLSYLPPDAEEEIRSIWFDGKGQPDAAQLFLRPSLQLPAILILEIAISRLWLKRGVKPTALIGHSMGENAAACLAGVMSFRDAVNLVRLRGELFETVEPGGMLSVSLSPDALKPLLPPKLDIASVNAPELCVVSGRNADLDEFRLVLAERGVDATRVQIDVAAHSRMLQPILGRFEKFLQSIRLQLPTIPIISNGSGDWLKPDEATNPQYWVDHLRSTVEFAKGMATLSKDPGRVYVEVGPGRTLSSLAKAQGTIDANRIINSLPHADDDWNDRLHFLSSVGRAWATGLTVDINDLWTGKGAKRVTLPTYPFQHRRYFIEPDTTGAVQADGEKALLKVPDMAHWGYRPAWKQTLSNYVSGAEANKSSWLFFLDDTGIGRRLVERLRGHGHRVVTVSLGDAFVRRHCDDYVMCGEMGRSGYDALLSGLAADGALPSNIVHMWLLTGEERFRPGSSFFHHTQECGFYSLLHLAQSLGDAGVTGDTHFTVITNGMQRVSDETLRYPEKATVLGPGLVLPKEISGATVRLIDVDLSSPAAVVRRRWRFGEHADHVSQKESSTVDELWEELFSGPASETIAYRQGRRWSRVYEKLVLDAVSPDQTTFRDKGVYLFTGGLGDLAFVMASELAERFKARLVLVGRTQLPKREGWCQYERLHGHDAVRRAFGAIRALEAKGAEVLYLTADVANPQDMDNAIRSAISHFGEINGVFHTAGVVDDDLMQIKTPERIESVLAPKVLGTAVLDEALRDVALDVFILFSSTSTDTAPAGQADYVAANAYLNAYAESNASRTDRRTIAVHWGIWNEVGIAARATGSGGVGGVDPVSAQVLGPFFQRWIEDESGVPWLEVEISPQSHWMLNEHRLVSGQPVMPGSGYVELIIQAAREYGLPLAIEISTLVFLRPLVVADGQIRTLRIRLEPSRDGFHATVTAADGTADIAPFGKFAEATLRPLSANEQQSLDIGAVALRCGERRCAEPGTTLLAAQENHIRFGPRWRVLRSVALGGEEALAELALPEAYRLGDGVLLHPALVDIATGFAMELAEDYRSSSVLWAPAAYGHVVIHKPLPANIVSWARLAADGSEFGNGYAAFDVTITDAEGDVVVEVRNFVMKRLDDDQVLAGSIDVAAAGLAGRRRPQPAPYTDQLVMQVRQGILPGEGFAALLRALATSEVQPVISSIDLDHLRERATRQVADRAVSVFERPELESEFVAPRNPVEETIASYWRELLGVTQVGVHDNFFDMGGHSLIAIRLFRMIKKQYALDFPISVLFEAPTIAQCADMILAQLPHAKDAEPSVADKTVQPAEIPSHLVLMHPGKDKEVPPLFICAGMFGNILNLRHLAQILGSTRPVYGLQARGLYGDHAPHETFEDMARDYIAEIRSVQPHGPYLLAGFSGGGIAAYEIAQQLLREGEQISHLLMLDTPLPRQPVLSMGDRTRMKLQDIFRHKSAFLTTWLRNRTQWENEKRQKRQAENENASPERFSNQKIENAFRRALLRYELKPYPGPVTLLRPKPTIFYRLDGGRHLQENRNIIREDNGWAPHVAELRVIEVPGDHDSMVLEPYVRVLADRMRSVVNTTIIKGSEKLEEQLREIDSPMLTEPA